MPPPDDEVPPPDDQGVIDLDPDTEPDAEQDPCLEAVVKHLPKSEPSSGFGFGAGLLLQFLFWPTIREHLHIKPKGQRGAPRKPLIDKAWNLWMQGCTHAEYCHKLQIPKEEQSNLKSAIRQRMRKLEEHERRAVTEAREQAQEQARQARQARRTQIKSVIKSR
jgi:hypothetical protein